MKKGIALCGGGGKGAYQIGVLKEMIKNRDLSQYDVISGTSVGALNAVLYSLGDYKLAEKIWLRYVHSKSLLEADFEDAVFSRDGLVEIMKLIDFSRLKTKVLINVLNETQGKIQSIHLNEKSEDEIPKWLLASSAIKIAYPGEYIGGNRYSDAGGTAIGNTPVEALINDGCDEILIIALSTFFNEDSVSGIDLRKNYKNKNFKVIKPSTDIGGFITGTFNFNEDKIRDLIAVGAGDYEIFKEKGMVEMSTTDNVKIRKLAEKCLESSEDFKLFCNSYKWSNTNLKIGTMGGKLWYDDIYEKDGWRIQNHNAPAMNNHYRILDPSDKRRGWTMDPDKLIVALQRFYNEEKSK